MGYIGHTPNWTAPTAAPPISGADITDDSLESVKIKAGTIVDSDINASAAIAQSKLVDIVNADVDASAAIATSKVSGAVTSIASHGLATSATTDTTNAANIGSGTLPDARFPATLPASSGANLTALPAGNITGVIPATNLGTGTANSGTFLNGAGAYSEAGGAWAVKSSGTLTTSSGLEVTGVTGTTMIFLSVKQSGTHASILMRTSSDGGTTYDSGASDYYRSNWDLIHADSTPSYNKSDFASFLCHGAKGSSNPGGDGSNSTGEYISMRITIIRPQDSTETQFLSEYTGIANTGGGDLGFHGHSGGYRKTAGVSNAFQIFSSSSGTMTGTYEIIHL